MARKRKTPETKNPIDLESALETEVSDDQALKIEGRGRKIRQIMTFIGFHWEMIKDLFMRWKRRCDHWEKMRKEHNDDNYGGCKFCPIWDHDLNRCDLKDHLIPMFKKEIKT